MAWNRGKQFEEKIRQQFESVYGVSIDRFPDQQSRYKGSTNICDFAVYKEPNLIYLECKSVHGNTLSIHSNDSKHKYGNISNAQWEGLLEKSKIPGVKAGILCWFIDRDVTAYIPIEFLQEQRRLGRKSVQYGLVTQCEFEHNTPLEVKGKKKRVFFEYDLEEFLKEVCKE